MMNARDHSRALSLETIDEINVPERFASIHHWSEQSSGQIDQLGLASRRVDLHLENMTIDVESLIELPGWMRHAKRIGSHNLLITRQQMHLRVDHPDEVIEWNLALKQAHAADVHCRFLLFEIEEARIHRSEPVIESWL